MIYNDELGSAVGLIFTIGKTAYQYVAGQQTVKRTDAAGKVDYISAAEADRIRDAQSSSAAERKLADDARTEAVIKKASLIGGVVVLAIVIGTMSGRKQGAKK